MTTNNYDGVARRLQAIKNNMRSLELVSHPDLVQQTNKVAAIIERQRAEASHDRDANPARSVEVVIS
jgi:hypothetical protein